MIHTIMTPRNTQSDAEYHAEALEMKKNGWKIASIRERRTSLSLSGITYKSIHLTKEES